MTAKGFDELVDDKEKSIVELLTKLVPLEMFNKAMKSQKRKNFNSIAKLYEQLTHADIIRLFMAHGVYKYD